jgi:3-dehydroquinate synthetase
MPLPYPLGTVLAALATDKKHTDGSLHWVLPTADGPVVRSDVPPELVERVAVALLAAPITPAGAGAGG